MIVSEKVVKQIKTLITKYILKGSSKNSDLEFYRQHGLDFLQYEFVKAEIKTSHSDTVNSLRDQKLDSKAVDGILDNFFMIKNTSYAREGLLPLNIYNLNMVEDFLPSREINRESNFYSCIINNKQMSEQQKSVLMTKVHAQYGYDECLLDDTVIKQIDDMSLFKDLLVDSYLKVMRSCSEIRNKGLLKDNKNCVSPMVGENLWKFISQDEKYVQRALQTFRGLVIKVSLRERVAILEKFIREGNTFDQVKGNFAKARNFLNEEAAAHRNINLIEVSSLLERVAKQKILELEVEAKDSNQQNEKSEFLNTTTSDAFHRKSSCLSKFHFLTTASKDIFDEITQSRKDKNGADKLKAQVEKIHQRNEKISIENSRSLVLILMALIKLLNTRNAFLAFSLTASPRSSPNKIRRK